MHKNIEEAWQYLRSYQRLNRLGTGGKLISPEAEDFRTDKRIGENLLDWCVRKARQELGDPLASLICSKCGWHEWDVDKVQTGMENQPDGTSTPVAYLTCPACDNLVEL